MGSTSRATPASGGALSLGRAEVRVHATDHELALRQDVDVSERAGATHAPKRAKIHHARCSVLLEEVRKPVALAGDAPLGRVVPHTARLVGEVAAVAIGDNVRDPLVGGREGVFGTRREVGEEPQPKFYVAASLSRCKFAA